MKHCITSHWYVYLIHFHGEGLPHGKQANTKHYTGIAHDVDARAVRHHAGQGARLMAVVTQRGIAWEVAEIRVCKDYHEAKALEKRLKQHSAGRRCPTCKEIKAGGHPTFSTFVGKRQPMKGAIKA